MCLCACLCACVGSDACMYLVLILLLIVYLLAFALLSATVIERVKHQSDFDGAEMLPIVCVVKIVLDLFVIAGEKRMDF